MALSKAILRFAALAVAVPLLGRYLAHVYTAPRHLAVERASYRLLRVDPDAGQVTTLGATATEPVHSERAWDRLRWLALGCGITAVLALVTLLRRRARRRTAPPADVR